MSPEKLTRMANQIATFFTTSADADPATAVADHLNAFWAPPMRQQLLEIIAAGGDGLDNLVIEGAPKIRPAPAS